MIELASDLNQLSPQIVVIGVGGAGGNAAENMMRRTTHGISFAVANTDAQALRRSSADTVIQLGRSTTFGLGAGSRAEIGAAAAEESLDEIRAVLADAHMCFITAGMGGGTGTGAAPVIARAAREMGILTVGVVTKPFAFEGRRRMAQAEAGLAELQQHVDTLIVIPNQNLFRVASTSTTFKEAFERADEVLQDGVRGITDLMTMPGLINLDFADVRTVMAGMGRAMLGTGEADGDDRAVRAAETAISNPLLDEALKGARGLLISISGGDDMRLMEVDEVATHVKDMVDADADIIWGSAFKPELEGRIRVSIVATGLDRADSQVATAEASERPPVALPEIARPAPYRPAAPRVFPQLRKPVPVPAPTVAPALPPLTPPPVADDLPTVDPFAPQAAPVPRPRLFERMAQAARGGALAGIDEGGAMLDEPVRRERRIHA
jgi:cell division protein FtsZ